MTTIADIATRFLREVRERALTVRSDANEVELVARAILWVGLLVLAWSYVFQPIPRSQIAPSAVHFLIGRVNTVFHEAGHVLFSVFGRFMSVLGGSLTQVLDPFVLTGAFLLRYDHPFGASVTLWWTGQSLIDLAPYIADARAQELILLGDVSGRDVPGYHDWNNLLRWAGLLHMDGALARLTHVAGAAIVVMALAWGGWLLRCQYLRLR